MPAFITRSMEKFPTCCPGLLGLFPGAVRVYDCHAIGGGCGRKLRGGSLQTGTSRAYPSMPHVAL